MAAAGNDRKSAWTTWVFGKFVGAGETGDSTWSFTTTSATSFYQIHTFSNLRSTVSVFMTATTRRRNDTGVTPLDIHSYVDEEMRINAYFFAPG